jgi:hypothetical protein
MKVFPFCTVPLLFADGSRESSTGRETCCLAQERLFVLPVSGIRSSFHRSKQANITRNSAVCSFMAEQT